MSLQKKTRVWNRDYPSMVSIVGRGKDRSPNGLGDSFRVFQNTIWMVDGGA
jgi:hypothetical protein